MEKELEQKEQCQVCHGNHYWVDQDDHVIQCPECTIEEPKELTNEKRT